MDEEQLSSITNELNEWGEVSDGVVDALVSEVRRLRDGIHDVSSWLVSLADEDKQADPDTVLKMLGALLDGT